MLRDLVAFVEGGAGGLQAAAFALDFAGIEQAHLGLTVVSHQALVAHMLDPMGAYYEEPEREEQHARDVAAIRAIADASPVDCDVRGLSGQTPFLPGRADIMSRCADLVMIGPVPNWSNRALRRRVVEAVLLDAAVPVLLYPPDARAAPIGHAVLGWNESAEAAQAARILKDVVRPGGTIDVVIVEPLAAGDALSSNPGREIVDHLARHGFHAELHNCPRGGRLVAEVLESFAVMRKAQLLAIGAYAHLRLRELIVGGVTRELIAFQRLPILMAH